jgi:hypothetical protein
MNHGSTYVSKLMFNNDLFLISLKKLPQGKVLPAPKGLVTSAQRVPAQTKKKKKLGQFSGSKPSGLSPQRALLNLGRPCGS